MSLIKTKRVTSKACSLDNVMFYYHLPLVFWCLEQVKSGNLSFFENGAETLIFSLINMLLDISGVLIHIGFLTDDSASFLLN